MPDRPAARSRAGPVKPSPAGADTFRTTPPSGREHQLLQERAPAAPRTDALAAVRRLSFAAIEATRADAIHRELARELLAVFAVDQVHISRIEPTGGTARSAAYYPSAEGEPVIGAGYRHDFKERSAVGRVVATGRPLHEPDARHSTVMKADLTERFGAASALFLPLAFGGEVAVVVALVSETPRHFEEQEIQLAYTLANQASTGLAALEMRSALAAHAERQTALARAAAALGAHLDRRSVLEALCREAAHAIGADFAGVYLGDARSGAVAVAAYGAEPGSDWFGQVVQPGERLAGRVLETGEPAFSNSYRDDISTPDVDVLGRVETAVSVPVHWNDALRGVLSIGFFSEHPIDAGEIETVRAVADLAGAACSNAEAFERSQEAARTDSLTGLLNHGAIQTRLAEEIARARRGDSPLSCLLIDLDDFKPVNDVHGHLVGDRVLRAVADTIRAEFRAYDAVGRLGGDELVMVLPDVDTGAALTIAARVRTMVAVRVAASELGVALTASVGVAGWYDPLTAGELLDRADRALLVAKRQGKDRALPASTETEAEFAQLEQAAGPAELVSQLWDLVSQCELPREVLDRLPSFLRRTLALEEVALYVPEGAASTDGLLALERSARARAPGDPAPPAFRELRLALDPERTRALSSGAISRDRLGELCRALGAEGTALATEEPAGSYAAVAVVRERELHALMLMRCAAPQFPLPRLRLAQLLSGQALTALVGQSRGAPRSAVGALAAAIDARDNYTHDHSEQVVSLAERTAKLLGLSPAETERVRDGAMLHDVGKVAIPNEILYNPGALDEEEWAIMCEHPVIGERILRRTPELEAIAPMVRHEHERWDGTGYPDGLARDEIPIGSRIILACDAYNAMITARPYRDPMTDAEAIDELRRAAGSQFDPEVVAALLEVLGGRETP